MGSKYKNIVIVFIVMIVCTLTLGYSAFGTEMSIASIAADVRIEKNVRVTGVSLKSANNGSINYVDYDADSILGNVNLKSFTSTVTLQVSVTNFGNEEMGIWDITGLPDNLYKTISGYEMKTKLCDQSGSCSLGSITTFDITLGYDTYDAVTKDHEFRLDFEFRKMHKITYTGITNNNYPTSVIDGGNLTFTATRNIPPKIVVFDSNNNRIDYDLYSYLNNTFNFDNVTSDIVLKYQAKAYMTDLASDTYFKESAYKTVIDSVYFVDYVDTSSAIKIYNLSKYSSNNDITAWVTSDNDLYIGSDWNIYGESFSHLFYGMSSVQTISFDNFNTGEATSMYYMFNGCSGLTSLDVSSFDTSQVKDMGRMFQGTSKLTRLDLSSFDTSKVTQMHGMFSGMTSLETLNVSNFNTSNVNQMKEMFKNVSKITSLDLSNFVTTKVTNMSLMFFGCSKLNELNLSSFNTSNVSNMSSMFHDMDSIVSLDLSNFNTSQVTIMESMFNSMDSLESINLTSFNTGNVTNMKWMFHYCKKLKSLNLSNFNTSNVTSMEGMLAGLYVATSIDVSNFDTSNVTNMRVMFGNLHNITSLDLSSFDTAKVANMESMFNNSYKLKNLKLNKATFDAVSNYDSMFYNCSPVEIEVGSASAQTFIQNVLGDGVGTVKIVTS